MGFAFRFKKHKVRANFYLLNSSRSGLQRLYVYVLMLRLWGDLPMQHYPVMTIGYYSF